MEFLEEIFANIWVQRGAQALIVLAFSGVVYFLVTRYLDRKEKTSAKHISQKKKKTFIHMAKSLFGYIMIAVTILMILQVYGVDVSSLLAGIGIISIVVGLALQDSLKDAFRGFDIISDDYYNVGDVIKFGEITGRVISISFRSTKIQDADTSNIVSIANRNITQVEVVSGSIFLNIPLPYDLSTEKAEKILIETLPEIRKDEEVISAKFLGFTKLGNYGKEYLFSIRCKPIEKLQVKRNALQVIVKSLEKQKISIPYPQLEITNK